MTTIRGSPLCRLVALGCPWEREYVDASLLKLTGEMMRGTGSSATSDWSGWHHHPWGSLIVVDLSRCGLICITVEREGFVNPSITAVSAMTVMQAGGAWIARLESTTEGVRGLTGYLCRLWWTARVHGIAAGTIEVFFSLSPLIFNECIAAFTFGLQFQYALKTEHDCLLGEAEQGEMGRETMSHEMNFLRVSAVSEYVVLDPSKNESDIDDGFSNLCFRKEGYVRYDYAIAHASEAESELQVELAFASPWNGWNGAREEYYDCCASVWSIGCVGAVGRGNIIV